VAKFEGDHLDTTEMSAIVDDHMLRVVQIKSSPYSRHFEASISAWEGWVQYTWKFLGRVSEVQNGM
jgi:hypothetical protein